MVLVGAAHSREGEPEDGGQAAFRGISRSRQVAFDRFIREKGDGDILAVNVRHAGGNRARGGTDRQRRKLCPLRFPVFVKIRRRGPAGQQLFKSNAYDGHGIQRGLRVYGIADVATHDTRLAPSRRQHHRLGTEGAGTAVALVARALVQKEDDLARGDRRAVVLQTHQEADLLVHRVHGARTVRRHGQRIGRDARQADQAAQPCVDETAE
ncbi:MAG: hypothetical protein BWY76_03098 [bacterium ADurb.Bin429]|nr:MAG: hypothetical protein BWY76_03098 [bacterium ADurb.Bin429]